MSYEEWWSLPQERFAAAEIRRVVMTSMRVGGLRAGVGYVPGQPEIIGLTVDEGKLDLNFCVTVSRARAIVDALDRGLGDLLARELAEIEERACDAGQTAVVGLSLYAAQAGWEGPRMLLSEEACDNRLVWPLACALGHILANVLGARLLDPAEDWPAWDPHAVLTRTG